MFSGSEKHDSEILDGCKLIDLMKDIEVKTGVPVGGQKLILNGKSLTSLDREKSLNELKFKDGSKVMVLGKKFDPQSDELYKAIVAIQEKSFSLAKKCAEVIYTFWIHNTLSPTYKDPLKDLGILSQRLESFGNQG